MSAGARMSLLAMASESVIGFPFSSADELAMFQHGERAAQRALPFEVDVGGDDAAAVFLAAVEHRTPGIDDHRLAPGLATVCVDAALRRGHHVGEVLDGACAHQDSQIPLPVAAL